MKAARKVGEAKKHESKPFFPTDFIFCGLICSLQPRLSTLRPTTLLYTP